LFRHSRIAASSLSGVVVGITLSYIYVAATRPLH
jgi:hypothetical protein